MIDLKRKTNKMQTTLRPMPDAGYSEPEYSWGLKITLEKSELDKLDIDIEDFKIGDVITAEIKAEVVRLSSSDSIDGSESKCLELQVQGMDLD
jgi:hypothetical protein